MVQARTATEEYPGLLEGSGAPGLPVATKEVWKSEMLAAMAIWSTAFNTNWPKLTINFVEAPNSDGGYEKPNNVAAQSEYDLPHEKGIGDLRFGRHQISGAKAHAYLPHGTLGEEGREGGDLHFNLADLSWRRDFDSGASGGNSMRRTGAHELGHAFGLCHTTYASAGASLMFVDFGGGGPPSTMSMSDFSNAIPPSDLACLKTLYEYGTLSSDCNAEGVIIRRWQKIVDAIALINGWFYGGDGEVITITYSFYVDAPVPKLHRTESGKLASFGTKVKYHDQSEADLCCGDCEHCKDSLAPRAWKIVLGDLEPNGLCDKCSDYNANYIVPKADPEYYDACNWRVFYETPGADDGCFPSYGVFLSVNYIGGRYTINVSFVFTSTAGLTEQIYFQKDYASVKPPCTELIDVPLTRGGASGGGVMWTCDEALATCRITACP